MPRFQAAASAFQATSRVDEERGRGRRLTPGALAFLRGRDADARLHELAAGRLALRPALGKLANAFLSRRLYHAVGYRCLGDWAREKLEMGDRVAGRLERAIAFRQPIDHEIGRLLRQVADRRLHREQAEALLRVVRPGDTTHARCRLRVRDGPRTTSASASDSASSREERPIDRET